MYVYYGKVWGLPAHELPDDDFESLTPAEIARLPWDQITNRLVTIDNDVISELYLEFPTTNLGPRFPAATTVTLFPIMDEELLLAVLMGQHARLGSDSPLLDLEPLILRGIVERALLD